MQSIECRSPSFLRVFVGFVFDGFLTITVLVLFFVLVLHAVGCAPIGSRATVGTSELVNPSPVTLMIKDSEKEGIVNGNGPARYTFISEDEIRTIQTGTTPRDVFAILKPDGTIRVNLSSGTDVNAEGLEIDPKTRTIKLARLTTSASEPIRAGNEALDRLKEYWSARDQAAKDATIEQIRATGKVADDMIPLILKLLSGT
jgi:hypothetical protein